MLHKRDLLRMALAVGAGVSFSRPAYTQAGPFLNMTTAGGGTAVYPDLADGKPTLLHFWATWCPPCREELPLLAEFYRRLQDEGVADRFVIISVDTRPKDQVESFVKEDLGLELDTFYADAKQAGGAFQLAGFPSTIWLTETGAEQHRHNGPLNWGNPNIQQAVIGYLA